MELIAALVLAAPLGYFGGAGRRGLVMYLVLWLIVFPIQTAVVRSENADDINIFYFLVNAVILAFGVAVNRLGARYRERRDARQAAS